MPGVTAANLARQDASDQYIPIGRLWEPACNVLVTTCPSGTSWRQPVAVV